VVVVVVAVMVAAVVAARWQLYVIYPFTECCLSALPVSVE